MDRRPRSFGRRHEVLEHVLTKLVDRQVRRIQNPVRDLPNGLELCLFPLNRVLQSARLAIALKRMRAAALAETPHEDVVSREQKDDRCGKAALFETLMGFRKVHEKASFPNVGDDGDAVDLTAFGGELGEGQDELRRQVVNAKKPGILESFHRQSLPGAGQPGDENESRSRWLRHQSVHMGAVAARLTPGRSAPDFHRVFDKERWSARFWRF